MRDVAAVVAALYDREGAVDWAGAQGPACSPACNVTLVSVTHHDVRYSKPPETQLPPTRKDALALFTCS